MWSTKSTKYQCVFTQSFLTILPAVCITVLFHEVEVKSMPTSNGLTSNHSPVHWFMPMIMYSSIHLNISTICSFFSFHVITTSGDLFFKFCFNTSTWSNLSTKIINLLNPLDWNSVMILSMCVILSRLFPYSLRYISGLSGASHLPASVNSLIV